MADEKNSATDSTNNENNIQDPQNTPDQNDKNIITDHEATIADLTKTISVQEKEIEQHEEVIDKAEKTIADQELKIASLQEKNDAQELVIKELRGKNAHLLTLMGDAAPKEEARPEKKKPTIPENPVTVDGKQFRFRFAAFYFKAKRYEAQDAALDNNLLKEILEQPGQTILKPVF